MREYFVVTGIGQHTKKKVVTRNEADDRGLQSFGKTTNWDYTTARLGRQTLSSISLPSSRCFLMKENRSPPAMYFITSTSSLRRQNTSRAVRFGYIFETDTTCEGRCVRQRILEEGEGRGNSLAVWLLMKTPSCAGSLCNFREICQKHRIWETSTERDGHSSK